MRCYLELHHIYFIIYLQIMKSFKHFLGDIVLSMSWENICNNGNPFHIKILCSNPLDLFKRFTLVCDEKGPPNTRIYQRGSLVFIRTILAEPRFEIFPCFPYAFSNEGSLNPDMNKIYDQCLKVEPIPNFLTKRESRRNTMVKKFPSFNTIQGMKNPLSKKNFTLEMVFN